MPSSLMSGVPATDTGYKTNVLCLRKRIGFADNGTAVTVGKLPAGAIVLAGSGAQVITAFNDSGTDVIDIGTSGDADEYATLLDVSSKGFKVIDETATHDGYDDTAEVTVTATYTGQNSNATAGSADIVILFVLK